MYCIFFACTGTSDPYVKFKVAGKEVFRSKTIHKNLNPVWDEKVSLLVESLREPLYMKVHDKSTVCWLYSQKTPASVLCCVK